MYDAKTLPLEWMSQYFKHALSQIHLSLTNIQKTDEFYGELMGECVDKIVARADKLPAGEATEMLEGLSQIMAILSGRIKDVQILSAFMADSSFVSSEELARIVQSPLLYESCYLPEALIPCVPKHLLPPEYHF